jgi:polyphosphate kinase
MDNFFDRDLSWLGFNHRVLMEASDNNVPLMERLKFLSIYSSNLDEFYRVRIPTLLSLKKIEKAKGAVQFSALVATIEGIIVSQMKQLGDILEQQIIPLLAQHKIHLVYNEPIPAFLNKDCADYFQGQVAGFLQPVLLNEKDPGVIIENNKLQILVLLLGDEGEEHLAVVNIPTDFLPRFYFCDDAGSGTRVIVFLDDIIKENLDKIFTGYKVSNSYSFKITRNADLDLQDEFEGDIADKIEKQLKKRDNGLATRFLYQPGISMRLLYTVFNKLNLTHANPVPGGNYHNLKNLSALPVRDKQHFLYESWDPVINLLADNTTSIFDKIAGNDIITHTPYQSYYPIIHFFNEASVDESVEEIYLTIYRVAHDSMIVSSLITAAKNNKKVTVFVELKARFDEENNLKWAAKMKEAGVKIIYSIPGLKVHAKVGLIKRRENGRLKYYGILSTGNFNETTAALYTDHILLTNHAGLVRELEMLFIFFGFRVQPKKYKALQFEHLLVAQFNMQLKFMQLIDSEIANVSRGAKGVMTLKMNSLEDKVIINKLYEASAAGVKINLIVRSICCLVAGVPGISENISVTRIVDRYLEHDRVFIFGNNGTPLVFMGSADWMNRSMYFRIEVCFPVYDEKIKEEIIQLVNIQLADNIKAVALNGQLQNIKKVCVEGNKLIRSQKEIYQLLNS